MEAVPQPSVPAVKKSFFSSSQKYHGNKGGKNSSVVRVVRQLLYLIWQGQDGDGIGDIGKGLQMKRWYKISRKEQKKRSFKNIFYVRSNTKHPPRLLRCCKPLHLRAAFCTRNIQKLLASQRHNYSQDWDRSLWQKYFSCHWKKGLAPNPTEGDRKALLPRLWSSPCLGKEAWCIIHLIFKTGWLKCISGPGCAMAELNAQEGWKWPQNVISARGVNFVWRDRFVWFILLRNGSSAPLTGPHMLF